jgi:hypothetical protein
VAMIHVGSPISLVSGLIGHFIQCGQACKFLLPSPIAAGTKR